MGGTIVVIYVNVSQKYIYARGKGRFGSHTWGVFLTQEVKLILKKSYLEEQTLHIIWGIFEKYKNWVLGGVEFGFRPFQTM
jgi:hypothetical protein